MDTSSYVMARKLPRADHEVVIAFSSALFRWCREAFLNVLSLFQMLFDCGSNSRAALLTSRSHGVHVLAIECLECPFQIQDTPDRTP